MQAQPLLIIGNYNYSSWSLRPWLLMRHYDVPFQVERLLLGTDSFHCEVRKYSPSGKVPALVHGEIDIWDSLAICEYVTETFDQVKGWPSDVRTRAEARAVAAEMHSGFLTLRTLMPMNVRQTLAPRGPNAELQAEIDRICQLWRDLRKAHGASGPFLFGPHLTIADAMYAPVVYRFISYQTELDSVCREYVNHMKGLPAMREWREASLAETEVLSIYEENEG
ncbi:Glutathione S-transferase family protein [Sulfidibacter corallicola]|uniref:Glutathione S-transferase family protein n=1 Tax=Sulfidibacter corallicola TaxID=2818388 RepID=A0A8A4TLM6_SULCO|nr:glutathione S-transferase family protein [Sulfidibacter corallicola]QTD50012.1 glutathione S-transferase family protein [Sulfidibacter corallicola]